jgi:ATP/maltotriose-dependent transcriptional regulator MalT
MTASAALDQAREAFRHQAWNDAYACFSTADDTGHLTASDLDLFASTAYLVGNDDHCVKLLERAYHDHLAAGAEHMAAETAFWLAFNLLHRGEEAPAGGWLARVARHLDTLQRECPAQGLLLVATALHALRQGDAAMALSTFAKAGEIGERCLHPELLALSGLGTGQARIDMGDAEDGLRRLDEVMAGVTAGEVSPIISGLVYCAVIIACHHTYHLRRAGEWTKALSRWCDAQPDLVPFRGQCLVHRAQILQLNGRWEDAMEQLHLARRRFAETPGQAATGMAFYEQGELHRLRGEYAEAEEAYRRCGECGHETQPGVALLRLGQGRLDVALAGIRRSLGETGDLDRPRLLEAYVEIALTAGDTEAARRAADELGAVAADRDVTMLHAMAAEATGAVLLAEGSARDALDHLRRGWSLWRELDAPYRCARARMLRGRACQELGDVDAAQTELTAAAEHFQRLRARPDLRRLERLGFRPAAGRHGVLTAREVQVLRAVATGQSNRAIAHELVLSEKTVARHVHNILTKLRVASRAAATAYAYENDLL